MYNYVYPENTPIFMALFATRTLRFPPVVFVTICMAFCITSPSLENKNTAGMLIPPLEPSPLMANIG